MKFPGRKGKIFFSQFQLFSEVIVASSVIAGNATTFDRERGGFLMRDSPKSGIFRAG